VDNNIGGAWHRTGHVTRHVEMRSQSIEHLSGVREVGFQGEDIYRWIWEWNEIQVEDFMSLGEKVRDSMSSGFTASLLNIR
jgi:hypothetical protein